MDKPLLNPTTDKKLALVLKDLPQSLLLTGSVGVGLSRIASYIGKTVGGVVLTVLHEKDEKIDIEKGTISIDSIRRLYAQTRTLQAQKLIIIIDYAERMAHPAQNAFLKLLEEPGSNIYFILASHTPSKLLPTVRSRTQNLDVQPITDAQSEALLDELGITSMQKRTQLLYMASGLPAELHRLVDNQAYFDEHATIVRDARDLLQARTYQRLIVAQKYKDNREGALMLLMSASNILRHSISEKPETSTISKIESLLYAYQQIEANGNIRLCLARFVV